MAFITLRQANVVVSPGGTVKGSPLTNSEVDNNFANINLVIGFRENLETNQTDNLVAAVNEINSDVGNVSLLTTATTSNLVAAVNEIDSDVGSLSALTTTATNNLVAAVNEVRTDLDNLSSSEISNGTSNINISTTNGPIEVSANFLPLTSNNINLGSDTRRFKDLFLSGNTINLGGDSISSAEGFIKINNNNVFTTSGNIVGDGSTLDNINAANIKSGTLSVTRGGTGNTSATFVDLAANVYNTLPVTRGGTGNTSATFVDLAANVYNTLPVTRGGTGLATLTANAILVGNGTSAVESVAAGTSGNVLTSNGSRWVSQAISAGGNYELLSFTSPGTWTKDAGLKAVKVTVLGGGGSGGPSSAPANIPSSAAAGGGAGGASVRYIDAASIPGPVSVTVGGAGGTSSFGPFASATGGSAGGTGGAFPSPEFLPTRPVGGAGGTGSSGTVNIPGAPGQPAVGTAPTPATSGFQDSGGSGGNSIFGGGARNQLSNRTAG